MKKIIGLIGFLLVATPCALPQDGALNIDNEAVVRLAIVNSPYQSGLLDVLLEGFTETTGLKVEIYSGTEVVDQVLKKEADILIAHYGIENLDKLVMDGTCNWPRPVFSNQGALIGPEDDPAKVAGLPLIKAIKKIAESESPFVINYSFGHYYLTNILLASLDPSKQIEDWIKEDWVIDDKLSKMRAVKLANQKKAYVLYGIHPFLKRRHEIDQLKLKPLVLQDPTLQRIMVSSVVRQGESEISKEMNARKLQKWLLSPEIQARVRKFRVKGLDVPLWWPAGRHGDPKFIIRDGS